MTRLDSKLEAAGAEFLVLGHLLIEGIQAFKAYINFPGYDVIATNPETQRSCRIQVKSRWATDFGGGFLINNYDCDFVVFVALNRGYRSPKAGVGPDAGRQPPQFYVFPVDVVRQARSEHSTWGKSLLRKIDKPEQYLDNWGQIAELLKA